MGKKESWKLKKRQEKLLDAKLGPPLSLSIRDSTKSHSRERHPEPLKK
jgi:hypothetical protein